MGAVFHVTDLNGNKLKDESVISYMEQVIFAPNPSFQSLYLHLVIVFVVEN